jgi:tetratricopeptide (TPR) repeat protein
MTKMILKNTVISFILVFILASGARAESISDIEKNMLNENYARAITVARRAFDRPLSLTERRRASYLVGICYLKLGNGKRAKEYFNRGLNDKADTITLDCLVGIADAYYVETQYESAIKRYDYILNKYRKIPDEANITYKLAQCYYRLGQWSKAKSYFKNTRNKYPESFEAEISREILDKNYFYYTVQVGSFGNKANADKLLVRLKRKRYPAYLDATKDEFNTFYRVRVGRFSEINEAKRYEDRLKKDGLPTKIYP